MRKTELQYLTKLLEANKAQILSNIQNSSHEISELLDNSTSSDEFDIASVNADQMIGQAISDQQIKELRDIDLALDKIKNKTYGICEMCDEPIAIARLKVKPHATYCINCREIIEKNERNKEKL